MASISKLNNPNFNLFQKPPILLSRVSFYPKFINFSTNSSLNSSIKSNNKNNNNLIAKSSTSQQYLTEIRNPNFPKFTVHKFTSTNLPFLLFTFITCTTCAALVGFVVVAVPSLHAIGRAANSFAKLADAAREELPSTMAAIRLSGMEISDLTLELTDLSHEISEGVNKSVQAVQAAENGIRQIGTLARDQTSLLIQERASLPVIGLQPVVSGAAKKTSRAVGYATRKFMKLISGVEFNSENEEDSVDVRDT